MMAFTGRWRELMKKYGKVALGVHLSVSAASISGLYIAIKNNVDVASVLEKVGLPGVSKQGEETSIGADIRIDPADRTAVVLVDDSDRSAVATEQPTKRDQTADLVASSGGALALAVLCNKALFPVRVPITIALTPPIARFLARRNIIRNV